MTSLRAVRSYSKQNKKPMNNIFSIVSVLVMLVAPMSAGTALARTSVASAADTSAVAKPQKKPAAKKAARKTAKPVYVQGSEETVAQRSARLKRECKGGVNAGACAGYTR